MLINKIPSPSAIHIPEPYKRKQLNTLYRENQLKDTTFRTLRKYLRAMSNLYGCIAVKDAYDIIARQSHSMVTEEQFISFVNIVRHECKGYYILCGEDLIPTRKSYGFIEVQFSR